MVNVVFGRAPMIHQCNTWGSIWTISMLAFAGKDPKRSLPFLNYKQNGIRRIRFWRPLVGESRGSIIKVGETADWSVPPTLSKPF